MQECKVIIAGNPLDLQRQINEALNQGYKVSGGISSNNGMYMTLVVRNR